MNNYWAIHSDAMKAVQAKFELAYKNGPVDDAARAGLPTQKYNDAAIIQVKGPIIKDAGWLSYFGFAGSRETLEALEAAAMDEGVDEIIMVMDTPGGSVDGLAEVGDAIHRINQLKPITVHVDGMLASAGYYIAAGASKIYANRMDLIGSIGTRIMLYDYSEYFNEMGIKAIPIDTGEHKSAGAEGTEITETQQAEFQRMVDGYFEDFINVIERGRNIPDLKSLADGRVFFAEEAVKNGLIDGIKSIESTLTSLQPSMQSTRHARARLKNLSFT